MDDINMAEQHNANPYTEIKLQMEYLKIARDTARTVCKLSHTNAKLKSHIEQLNQAILGTIVYPKWIVQKGDKVTKDINEAVGLATKKGLAEKARMEKQAQIDKNSTRIDECKTAYINLVQSAYRNLHETCPDASPYGDMEQAVADATLNAKEAFCRQFILIDQQFREKQIKDAKKEQEKHERFQAKQDYENNTVELTRKDFDALMKIKTSKKDKAKPSSSNQANSNPKSNPKKKQAQDKNKGKAKDTTSSNTGKKNAKQNGKTKKRKNKDF
jgi:hypothetical protein